MKIDMKKPVFTKDGRKVTLFTDKAKGNYPFVGQVEGTVSLYSWCNNGQMFLDKPNPCDLAPQTEEVWLNFYANGQTGVFTGPQAKHNASSCVANVGVVARKCVKYNIGEFDDQN